MFTSKQFYFFPTFVGTVLCILTLMWECVLCHKCACAHASSCTCTWQHGYILMTKLLHSTAWDQKLHRIPYNDLKSYLIIHHIWNHYSAVDFKFLSQPYSHCFFKTNPCKDQNQQHITQKQNCRINKKHPPLTIILWYERLLWRRNFSVSGELYICISLIFVCGSQLQPPGSHWRHKSLKTAHKCSLT